MKKVLSKILISGILVSGSLVFTNKPSLAYCVYNDSNETISALQLPISPRSFKVVIPPKDKACCNWKETSCTKDADGRYGKTPFVILKGSVDIGLITVVAVFDRINRVALPFIPVVGSGMTAGYNEVMQELDRLSISGGLGIVNTYNGGIVWYDGSREPLGCWQGPCQGHDINGDGSTGSKP